MDISESDIIRHTSIKNDQHIFGELLVLVHTRPLEPLKHLDIGGYIALQDAIIMLAFNEKTEFLPLVQTNAYMRSISESVCVPKRGNNAILVNNL